MDLKDRRLQITIIGAFMLLTIAISTGYFFFGRAGLQAVSIIATSLLTLALVVLYWQQHLSLRYQQEPLLEVSDLAIHGNLQQFDLDVSNFGGGPATSMELQIGFYSLGGDGPIRTVGGELRRVEFDRNDLEEHTMASSIRPTEMNILFRAESKGVISSGSSSRNQDSIASIVHKLLDDGRNVVYGKVTIIYTTNFSKSSKHVADFSIKFTEHDELSYELMEFLPWEEQNEIKALGD